MKMALVASAVALKRWQRLLQNDDCGDWTARTVVDSFFRLNQEWSVVEKRRLGGTGKRGVDARICSFKAIF